jgi:multidrug efflux pump subunit AcrB
MRGVIAYFVHNPILTNVLILVLLGAGGLSLSAMRASFFPELDSETVNIEVTYPGASPEEIEEGVVLKIEEELEGIDAIERVTSESLENFASIQVEALKGSDMAELTQDVKNAVDRINSLPQDAEQPIVYYRKSRGNVFDIALFGSADLYNLKRMAETMRDELLVSPAISQVSIEGKPELELSIDVEEEALRRHGLRFEDISGAVAAANINLTGGKLETREEEMLIRAWGRRYQASELEDIVVSANPDGSIVRLDDIANVVERWADTPERSYYNGQPTLILRLQKTISEDILEVAEIGSVIVEQFNRENEQVQAVILGDFTIPLKQRLGILYKNGLIGLGLVVLLLGLFMNFRLAAWVSLGIPLSLAGMFIVSASVGITINVISLFGMIVVIGILVDDAIVVGENIYARYEAGDSPADAAVNGTMEVIKPVTTSVLTTVVAFTPFFFLDGFIGKFIWHMALVVVAALLFSLIEAYFILPAHLAHSRGLHPHSQDARFRRRLDAGVQFLIHRIYAPLLRAVIHHKAVTLCIPIALLLVTIGLIRGGLIGVTPFPFIDGDEIPINLTLVAGTQEQETDAILQQIERAALQLNQQLRAERSDQRDVIIGIKRDIGSNDFGDSGSHAGKLTLFLLDGETRDMGSFLIGNRLREVVGPIHNARNLTYGRSSFFGKPIAVSLLGDDIQQLERARTLLINELEAFSSLRDVTDSNQQGRREISLQLNPLAHALGLSLQDVAGQVRQGFFGLEIQRIQRGRDELRVWVRYRPEDRLALGQLERMRIRTPDGASYPLRELASYQIERGLTKINHLDKKREIRVEADLADVTEDLPPILDKIQRDVMPRVLAQVDGVRVSYEGQSRDQLKTNSSMQRTFPLALLTMFILLVLVFRSWGQALQIFSLIPLAIVGAVFGHGIHGLQLNTLSIYGIIALAGIIINDSVVLLDKINSNLRKGMQLQESVYQAALARFRPIILTTLTTVVGLAPLILETSRQAQFLIPMAVSVAYGLLFGTFLLLLVLPAQYLLVNRLRVLLNSAPWRQEYPEPESVEPAVKQLRAEAARR